ncbi:MAG: hypothetical protein R2825_08905 [Saprospiraceae bacterium]
MAGQPNIKIPTLANLVLPLPEQQAIVATVEALLGRVSALSAESEQQRSWAEACCRRRCGRRWDKRGSPPTPLSNSNGRGLSFPAPPSLVPDVRAGVVGGTLSADR